MIEELGGPGEFVSFVLGEVDAVFDRDRGL